MRSVSVIQGQGPYPVDLWAQGLAGACLKVIHWALHMCMRQEAAAKGLCSASGARGLKAASGCRPCAVCLGEQGVSAEHGQRPIIGCSQWMGQKVTRYAMCLLCTSNPVPPPHYVMCLLCTSHPIPPPHYAMGLLCTSHPVPPPIEAKVCCATVNPVQPPHTY